jgi:hypothetical protein
MRYRLITLMGVVTATAVMTAVFRVERDWGACLLWPSWTAGGIHVLEQSLSRSAGAVRRMCGAIAAGCVGGALLAAVIYAAGEPDFPTHFYLAASPWRKLLGVVLLAGIAQGASGGALFGMMQGLLYAAPRRTL